MIGVHYAQSFQHLNVFPVQMRFDYINLAGFKTFFTLNNYRNRYIKKLLEQLEGLAGDTCVLRVNVQHHLCASGQFQSSIQFQQGGELGGAAALIIAGIPGEFVFGFTGKTCGYPTQSNPLRR
jgi:hypothetical protein